MKNCLIIFILPFLPVFAFSQDTAKSASNSPCFPKKFYAQEMKINKKYRKYDITRTSNNDSILRKYINYNRCRGGERYIVALQQKYKIEKINDSTYKVKIRNPKDTAGICMFRNEDGNELDLFLDIPIGKPNGTVVLFDRKGNKVRESNYKNEMKNGLFLSRYEIPSDPNRTPTDGYIINETELYRNDEFVENKKQ